MQVWTNEKVIQLLLLVIKNHVKVVPDYDFLAGHLGVSREAARQKYNNLKREFDVSDTPGANPTTPPTTPPKRKAANIAKSKTVMKESGSESDSDFGDRKRVRISRAAASKANAKIKEEYQKMEGFLEDEQE
jgi:DNA-binding transcriptional MocR family regulator